MLHKPILVVDTIAFRGVKGSHGNTVRTVNPTRVFDCDFGVGITLRSGYQKRLNIITTMNYRFCQPLNTALLII